MTPQVPDTFHPRIINNYISFTNSEMTLLLKGMKYNTHSKKRNWIQSLSLEAETAITQLPPRERVVYRKLIADRINKLIMQNPTHQTPCNKSDDVNPKQTKRKHRYGDTGRQRNPIVILTTLQYVTKLQNFVLNNNFSTINAEPTSTFQVEVRQTIRDSKSLIPNDTRWRYTNMRMTS